MNTKKKRLTRLLALVLTLATLVSSLSLPVYADDIPKDTMDQNAAGGGNHGGGSSGTMWTTKSGYRMYIIDKQGNQVSNTVDFIFDTPCFTSGAVYYNTKLQSIIKSSDATKWPSGYQRIKISEFTSDLTDSKMPLKGSWPTPITYNGKFKGNGDNLRIWFTDSSGQTNFVGGTTKSELEEMYADAPWNWSPTQEEFKEIAGTVVEQLMMIEKTMVNDFFGCKSMGFSYYWACEKVYRTASSLLDQLRDSGEFSWEQTRIFDTTAADIMLNLYNQPQWDFWLLDTNFSKRDDPHYIGDEVATWSDAEKKELLNNYKYDQARIDREYTSIFDSTDYSDYYGLLLADKPSAASNNVSNDPLGIDGYATFSASDLLQIAYADEETSKESFERVNGFNLIKIVGASTTDGNYIFQLDGIKYSPAPVFNDDGSKAGSDPSGKTSMLQTLYDNGLTIAVEALYWFIPARAGDTHRYVGGYFYGTVTNYGQFLAAGYYDDGGSSKYSHYGSSINNTAAIALYTPNDTVTDAEVTVFKGITPTNKYVPAATLANTDLGYDLHTYIFHGMSGFQSTSTRDPLANDEPAPAPDPDTIEKTDYEKLLEEKGEDLSKTTRTIHIIKVYQHEDILGNITHVSTHYREDNPDVIRIDHEEYKVVEWFSSEVDIADKPGVDLTDTLTWEEIEGIVSYDDDSITIEDPTGIYDDLLDSGVTPGVITPFSYKSDSATYKWEDVCDKEPGKQAAIVDLNIACQCDTENPENGRHYRDQALYVRLLAKDEPPETHTWDDETYPDGDPGPAPEPPDPPAPPEGYTERDIEEMFPYDIDIVKVYRTLNIDDGTYTHDGTYMRDANPGTITVDNEPQYKLKEWYVSVDGKEEFSPNINAGTTWETVKSTASVTGESGKSSKKIEVADPQTTLYVLLERKITNPVTPPPVTMDEDLTESQLTKISNTNSAEFNWSGYKFTASLAAARLSHSYTKHVGCTHSCSSDECTHSCDGHCGCPAGATCSHMSRAYGDNYVSATFGMKDSWKDRHETTVATPSAHSDFAGKMYGLGGLVQDSILFDETVNDGAYNTSVWSLGSDGSNVNGIEYITTISRASVGDKLNLAKYKQSAMNATSYARINTIFPGANTPTGKRLANGAITESLSYTIGHIDYDDEATSTCSGSPCTCSANTCAYSSHTPEYDTKYVKYSTSAGGSHDMTLTGSFKVFTYGGLGAKTAKEQPTNLTGQYITFTDSGEASEHSALYVVPQTATIKYYPYVKMSYMITTDNISFPGYTAPADSNGRTVYMLSDKQSTIIPTNSVEVSWFNKTQADGGYGLQMTSTQWSTHSRAVNGDDGWQGPNQVLPGGALYQLNTKDTESYIKIITYNTLVENGSRQWISVSDSSKYTIDSIINSTQNFLNEAKNVIENFRIVQWVSTKLGTTAWEDTANSVKIANGGESLSNLGLGGKASTDSKYLLINGTNNQAVNEADIDIEREAYQTTLFKGFTDVDGNVYVAAITVDTSIKMLDKATLTQITNLIKDVCGTNIKSSISGMTSDMSYTIVKIGNKADTLAKILQNLQNNSQYSYLYTIDVKTKFISNLIKSVERNTGSDANATWTTDGKWYNEAFDGIYLVMQTATYKVGIGVPSIRTSVLDPNLCPSKGSTSQLFTNAHMSQFCMDSKSTVAQDEDDHYIGTYEGTKVYLPDLETMYISRPFYIPNANVQDLT